MANRETSRRFALLGSRHMSSPLDYRALFDAALPLADYIAGAQKNKELWEAVYRHARVDPEVVAHVAALPGPVRLLVLSEDWCGDAVNSVPVVARLAELAPNLELRVLARDEHPDLMDAYLTNGTRSIPVVIALDPHFVPLGWRSEERRV